MSVLSILLIAVGLAMDAFAVSISCGVTMKKLRVRPAFRIAFAFGSFQALMPVVGYLAGLSVRRLIARFDHWVAFGLLAFIGCKMIYESFMLEENRARSTDAEHLPTLLILSIATSIDALAVGISLSLLKVEILEPALIIGVVTFAISLAGTVIGTRIGHLFERKMELLGGIILVVIGLRILYNHIFGASGTP